MNLILRRTDVSGRGQEVEMEDEGSQTSRTERSYRCPFHQDHQPSLSVNHEKRCFHCFSCGASGVLLAHPQEGQKGWFELERRSAEPVVDPHELERRRELLRLTYSYALDAQPSAQAVAYLQLRGLSWEQVQKQGGAYFPAAAPQFIECARQAGFSVSQLLEAGLLKKRGAGGAGLQSPLARRLVFPLTAEGELTNLAGRALDASSTLKWLFLRNLPGCVKGIFAEASLHFNRVIVTESVFDALVWQLAGKAAFGAMGVHLPVWLRPKLQGKEVYLAFNSDAAGDKATSTWAKELHRVALEVRRVPLPSVANDWSEYAAKRSQLQGARQ